MWKCKDIFQELYQLNKVGLSEALARHMASFPLILPTVLGRVKTGPPLQQNIISLL
jgi:hypothetical protein